MKAILTELKKYSSQKRKKSNEWFFKTGKGEYGEGDKFIGVTVPNIRKVAKRFSGTLKLKDIEQGLKSPIHEVRLCSLIILVDMYKKGDTEKDKKKIFDFYMRHAKKVNNWDLVDSSAPYISGEYLVEHQKEITILYRFAKSKNLWERRIAIISTYAFIKRLYVDECLKISKQLLGDEHDLIHKAVGWMLREAWKKKPKKIEDFIKGNYKKMPRTTLRYAIERMQEKKRKRYLKGEF